MSKPRVPHVRGPDTEAGEETLVCRECKAAKILRVMWKNQDCKRPTNICKTCKTAKQRWRAQGFECSWALYDSMFKAQGGVCAICAGPQAGFRKRFNVDHDHATGKVRGLLCHSCNVSLGHFGDDTAMLRKAIAYVEAHRAPVGVTNEAA